MKKAGIIYWPLGGNTETVSEKIQEKLQGFSERVKCESIHINQLNEDKLNSFDFLIVGGPTVGADNWQNTDANNEWLNFYDLIHSMDLTGKKVALFGLGDQVLYPDNFVDSMAILREEFLKQGATIVGAWPTEGYDFSDSKAVDGDYFFGLAIDEDQQAELTEKRILGWIDILLEEFDV